jgi:hypothetical protein
MTEEYFQNYILNPGFVKLIAENLSSPLLRKALFQGAKLLYEKQLENYTTEYGLQLYYDQLKELRDKHSYNYAKYINDNYDFDGMSENDESFRILILAFGFLLTNVHSPNDIMVFLNYVEKNLVVNNSALYFRYSKCSSLYEDEARYSLGLFFVFFFNLLYM